IEVAEEVHSGGNDEGDDHALLAAEVASGKDKEHREGGEKGRGFQSVHGVRLSRPLFLFLTRMRGKRSRAARGSGITDQALGGFGAVPVALSRFRDGFRARMKKLGDFACK